MDLSLGLKVTPLAFAIQIGTYKYTHEKYTKKYLRMKELKIYYQKANAVVHVIIRSSLALFTWKALVITCFLLPSLLPLR